MSFTSYASNFEDVLLDRIFHDVEHGFYIDIGADHPTFSSTTKAFYDRGWSGINVEPGPNYALIETERRRDININGVVTDRDGEVDFFHNDDLPATSSIYEAIHPAVAARVSHRSRARVRSYTLDSLVERHVQRKDVHFLKIDAEGSEEAIILSTDWSRFRPMVIVAESSAPFSTIRVDQQWAPYLATQGFVEVYLDGINTWFVREESKELQEHFAIPVNLLDDFILFDYEKIALKAKLDELTSRLDRRSRWTSRVVERLKAFLGH